MQLSMNAVTLLYLVASICFIQALKGLSHPTTSRRGNAFGMAGMALAVLTTIALIYKIQSETFGHGIGYVLFGLLVGGSVGTLMAKRVEMTKMPELVAFMHSMIGLAAVAIAVAAVAEPAAFGITHIGSTQLPLGNRLELFSVPLWAQLLFLAQLLRLVSSVANTSSVYFKALPCVLPVSIF
jgi:NAD(P) transhydrogenase subunit beta